MHDRSRAYFGSLLVFVTALYVYTAVSFVNALDPGIKKAKETSWKSAVPLVDERSSPSNPRVWSTDQLHRHVRIHNLLAYVLRNFHGRQLVSTDTRFSRAGVIFLYFFFLSFDMLREVCSLN